MAPMAKDRMLSNDIREIPVATNRGKHRQPRAKVMRVLKRTIHADMEKQFDSEENRMIVRDTRVLFEELCKELPHVGSQVTTILGERARWHILSDRYSHMAMKVGLDTKTGMKLMEMALALSARAETAAVKAFNLSMKLTQYENTRVADKEQAAPWLTTEGSDVDEDDDEESDDSTLALPPHDSE